MKDNTNSFYRKDKIGEGYELEYVLFVENNRKDLNQSVASYEENSVNNRHDTEPQLSKRSVSNVEAMKMMSLREHSSMMEEPSLGRRQPRRMNELFEVEEPLNQTTSVVATELRNEKDSTVVARKRPYKEGSAQTKLILLSFVVAIGILVYFIVVVSNNSRQLNELKSRLADLMM